MDIWIIRDGEKVGPIPDYEVRRRIESGEFDAATPAWHEGLSQWRPMAEIPVFKAEFERSDKGRVEEEGEEPAGPVLPEVVPPPLPGQRALGRRFWARWLDIHAYLAFWWLGMWVAGRDIEGALSSALMLVVQLVPWFIIESVLLHRYGTTPGKWLLGLRVVNNDGSLLAVPAALLRSFRILVGGIGFGWGLLAIFCQAFTFFTVRKLGRPLWDHAGGHRVEVGPLVAWRIVAVVCGLFVAIQLQMAVISPYVIEDAVRSFPALKELLDQNPPWHLPERSDGR